MVAGGCLCPSFSTLMAHEPEPPLPAPPCISASFWCSVATRSTRYTYSRFLTARDTGSSQPRWWGRRLGSSQCSETSSRNTSSVSHSHLVVGFLFEVIEKQGFWAFIFSGMSRRQCVRFWVFRESLSLQGAGMVCCEPLKLARELLILHA